MLYLFFGAIRTLPLTIDTIKEVIQQFRELYDVTIFVHTWKGEDFKLLEPDYYRTTDQQEQFKNLKTPEYTTIEKQKEKLAETMDEQHKKWDQEWLNKNIKSHRSDYYITTNYATYSKKQVTSLALSKIPNPELVVYIRPDTLFKTINIPSLLKQFNRNSKRIQIITPDFDNIYWNKDLGRSKLDKTGKRGVNDRFAICLGSSAAKVYGSQYDHIDDLEKEMIFIHGEPVLEWVFKNYNVVNIRSPMCFYLLRSGDKKTGTCKGDKKGYGMINYTMINNKDVPN
jgi:hypothetical protein